MTTTTDAATAARRYHLSEALDALRGALGGVRAAVAEAGGGLDDAGAAAVAESLAMAGAHLQAAGDAAAGRSVFDPTGPVS